MKGIVTHWQVWQLALRNTTLPNLLGGVELPYRVNLSTLNTLRPRQNGRRFADDTFKRIFLNENVRISIKISLKCGPKGRINTIPALFLIMAWRRSGDKPLSGPMIVSLLTHICVTRPQWVKPYVDMNIIYNDRACQLVVISRVTIFW